LNIDRQSLFVSRIIIDDHRRVVRRQGQILFVIELDRDAIGREREFISREIGVSVITIGGPRARRRGAVIIPRPIKIPAPVGRVEVGVIENGPDRGEAP